MRLKAAKQGTKRFKFRQADTGHNVSIVEIRMQDVIRVTVPKYWNEIDIKLMREFVRPAKIDGLEDNGQ